MSEGWIKLHRSILHNNLWLSEPFARSQAWVDLLLLASHKPSFFYIRGNRIDVERGEVAWSEQKLALRWQWSRGKVRGFLQTLKSEQQIEQRKSNIINKIAILNYDSYQDVEQQTEQQKADRKPTESRQKNTNKKDKKDNNNKNENNKDKDKGCPFNIELFLSDKLRTEIKRNDCPRLDFGGSVIPAYHKFMVGKKTPNNPIGSFRGFAKKYYKDHVKAYGVP